MGARHIAPELEPAILDKAGQGWASTRIAAWLATEHDTSVDDRTVRRLLARHRAERAELTRAVTVEKLGATLTPDLDRLEAIRAGLQAEGEAMRGSNGRVPKDSLGAYLRVTDLEIRVLDRKLHYAGADEATTKGQNERFPGLGDLLSEGFGDEGAGALG